MSPPSGDDDGMRKWFSWWEVMVLTPVLAFSVTVIAALSPLPFIPSSYSWLELVLAFAGIAAALFAGLAFWETRLDRQRRDEPRLRLMPGPVHFGAQVKQTAGHVRNVGHGPALKIVVVFGDITIRVGPPDAEDAPSIVMRPNNGWIEALFERNHLGHPVFEARFVRRLVRTILIETESDFNPEGIEVTFKRAWEVGIQGTLSLRYEDRGGRPLGDALPFRLEGQLNGTSSPPRANLPGRKQRHHRGQFTGTLSDGRE